MSTACDSPLSFERFADYWFGDLPQPEQDLLEEHLLACPLCGGRADAWGQQLHTLARAAEPLPRGFLQLDELARVRQRTRVFDVVAPEMTVDLESAELQVFRVALEPELLAELERLDVEYLKEGYDEPIFHVSDVPLQPFSPQLHFACHSHVLQAHGDATMRLVGTRRGQRFTVLESLVHMQ